RSTSETGTITTSSFMFIITAPFLSTPTVVAENSVRVLPWHSIRLASESRSKPHPRHSLSEHPQPISAAAMEHSAIEQTQGAIRALLKVDHSQSDKSQDCLALLLQRWRSLRPQCVTTTRRLRHCRRPGTVAVAPVEQHRHLGGTRCRVHR